MNTNIPSEKNAGIALIVFVILLLLTMGLHPAGGSIEHLIRITTLIVVTHSIAILSLPIGWIGFRGLTRRIGGTYPGPGHFLSSLSLAIAAMGLVAALLAAATNGLVLPIFLQHYKDAAPEALAAIKPIIQYSFAINHAFDYVYTGAFCLAILGWSLTILKTRALPVWIGWLGIALSLAIAAVFIGGMAVNTVSGLRVFIAGVVAWILVVGIYI